MPRTPKSPADDPLASRRAALLKRYRAGARLTAEQLNEISDLLPPSSAATSSDPSAFAKTQHELAQRLGISRKTITNHQKDAGAPLTRADGRYDVAAWSAFLREHNIIDEGGDDDDPKKNWKHELDRLKCQEIQLNLDTIRRDLVSMAEVVSACGRTVNAFRIALNQLPGRIAQSTVGLKDYDEIREVVDSEITILLRSLEHASFLDDDEQNKPVLGEVEPELVEEDQSAISHGSKLEKPIRGRVKVPPVKVPKATKKLASKRKSKKAASRR